MRNLKFQISNLKWASALAALLLGQGCMVNVYHRYHGPTSFTGGLLMNEEMRRLAIDHMNKSSSTGFSATGVATEVDNEAVKAVAEGAVKAALGIP